MAGHLNRARTLVLDWLRADQREPAFLQGETDRALERRHEEITQRFLEEARQAGFDCEVVPMKVDGRNAFEVFWTHRGSSFVGFKQPPPEANVEDAVLVGCAALLENQWCLQKLEQ
jgi:hypothetical protein